MKSIWKRPGTSMSADRSQNIRQSSTRSTTVQRGVGNSRKHFDTAGWNPSVDALSTKDRSTLSSIEQEIDVKMGFDTYDVGPSRIGWLINMHSTVIDEAEGDNALAAVNYYFLDENGDNFKVSMKFDPYFLIGCRAGKEADVEEYLRRKYEGLIKKTVQIVKDDLSMPNHLVGNRSVFIKLLFTNVSNLLAVRRELLPLVEKNRKLLDAMDVYADTLAGDIEYDNDFTELSLNQRISRDVDVTDYISDIREYDVPYHVRVAIDADIRIGKWYTVEAVHGDILITEMPERLTRPDPVILAFDIETTKLPLKFPDVQIDQIMMISYMIDGNGFLITNREIVSQDIEDFEYTPKPELEGIFTIFNEKDEKALIERFFEHVQGAKPTVIVTYNGDFFDWPFVEGRARVHGIDMYREIGFQKDSEEEYKSSYCCHMDAFRWVKRDSYLPQGSQGLKAVTTAKMGYDPIELDPELMTRYAVERPQTLSEYSVSDAVATYYLYMKYVHPFIFSLCNILPLNPDEVLRKGTGTLCEMLLMVEAYRGEIVLPNKHKEAEERFHDGHLVESETYVGGHVESLEAGVFRSDIPADFRVDEKTVDRLLSELSRALKFFIEVESKKCVEDVVNYDEVYTQIYKQLSDIKENPRRSECPLIYHLDVSSMYPNIMITNRLQPDSMISEADCATCDFNRPGKSCDRRLPWMWRGEYFPAKKDEYNMIKRQLQNESFPSKVVNQPAKSFDDLPMVEQNALIKKRISEYSKKVYHRLKETKLIEKEAIICQRENPFYADTVRAFRDRRYDFKNKQKLWKRNLEQIVKGDTASREEAQKMIILYDSMQLAHKVILNSFYGYVMRKGSRWYSMEMAGVTCLTGATIIQMARELVENIGRPLELDTDGIWCILPKSFPENFSLKLKDGKKLSLSYPCVMLNHLVHDRFTNHQYQTLENPMLMKYNVHSENSIFFEVDGPYRAMILPASKEEDKNLKKRYAVFNNDGSLAELKGFEVKRRGELRLIKIFQSQIFKVFLEGQTLEECYAQVAKVSNRWLDVLDSKGMMLADDELIELICENRSMSRALEEYGRQKSASISTARRLAEFLGDQMVKDKGLACKYIISEHPRSAPVTERAIPVAIFSAEESVKSHFLRRWLKDTSLTDFDPRGIIDWDYYRERLGSVIQKIITIPAALQHVPNPVPRVRHPDWLHRRLARLESGAQSSIDSFKTAFKPMADVTNRLNQTQLDDIEDIGFKSKPSLARGTLAKVAMKRRRQQAESLTENIEDMFASLPAEMPDVSKDYRGWLRYEKQKWKIQQQALQRRHHLFGKANVRSSISNDSQFFKSHVETTYNRQWHILRISNSDIPGELRVWLRIADRNQVVKIRTKRKIYVDFKDHDIPSLEIPDMIVEKVSHILPNGNHSNNLFRLTMSEEAYQQEQSKVASMFNHPGILAVYESNVDLVSRTILDLGHSCQLDMTQPGILGRGLESGFDMSSLIKCDGGSNYLKGSNMKYVVIYHSISGDRHAYAIFSTADNIAEIYIFESNAKQQQQLPRMDPIYETEYQNMLNSGQLEGNLFEIPSKLEFHVTHESSLRKVKRAVSSSITKRTSSAEGQVILAVISCRPQSIEKDFAVVRDLPILEFTTSGAENSFPVLGWQLPLARRTVLQYLRLGTRIKKLLNTARYSNIPICNLRSDDMRLVIDVQYARKLQEANVILWWSPTPVADVGGAEKDRPLLLTENLDMPIINSPSSYDNVCVEISVQNLTINTVLTSALINETEGSFTTSGDASGSFSFTENASSAAAISVLQDLVKQWWEEAMAQNANADLMVNSFVQWVSSGDSYLYDPILQYHVRNLSRKAFLQLLAEFRRVGSRIIYARQDKLVIETSKAVVANAYAYAQYIVKGIRAKPLFNFIEMKITKYWDYLLWMDDVNYGGFSCTEVIDEKDQMFSLAMNWHIRSFLPEILQREFSTWVEDFLRRLHTAKAVTGMPTPSSTPRATQLRAKQTDEEYFGKGTVKSMKQSLHKRIVQLCRRQSDSYTNELAAAEFEFPVQPGSQLNLINPTLELVKSLTAVFSLARGMTLEVRLVRRDLLSIFEIKEFSDDGLFKNPSASLGLAFVCSTCSLESELDFCRDESLIPETSGGAKSKPWRCKHCEHEIDQLEIEEQMLGNLQAMLISFQLQDIRCGKCRQMKSDYLSEHCPCSGEWELSISKKELIQKLQIYTKVGQYYGLQMVNNMISGIVLPNAQV
ncbi:uncharacterized protein V1516DRAFT_679244 [Lipomyces oligophaga]|uniref:uncharacterized protein n=1 Tax=Lipomyces oligophaga TaxID=45792 RepID=UPI0034CEBAE7